MKIAIIGYSGSGKSTLTQKLSEHYSIPKLHMDRLQFQPGWKDSDRDWMSEQMDNFLSKNTDWIIDGNYSWCFYERRMAEADQIIFLNFSRWNCLYRAFKRYLKYRNRTRESLTGSLSAGFFGKDDVRLHWQDIRKSDKLFLRNLSNYPIKKS